MYKKLFIRLCYAKKTWLSDASKLTKTIFPLFLAAMRFSLIHILLLALTFQVGLSSNIKAQKILDKKITIALSDQDLETALKKVAVKADVRLVYNNSLWKNTPTVSINVKETKLKLALDEILKDSKLYYEVINDQFIVLKRVKPNKEPATNIVSPVPDEVQSTTNKGFVISGIVTDELDQPIPGVTVQIKETSQTAITNDKGRYVVGVTNPGSTAVFTYVGYQTVNIIVRDEGPYNVKLKPDPGKLDEVLIIGYGTTTRRTSTGSQAGISAKDIEKQPVTNLLQTMQARMPGVAVTQTNGLPGAGINVQIRGVNSIAKSNRPLYIVDGVPFLSEPINTATGTSSVLPSAEGQTSPMNTINPSDIESLEVLKDADATAIYGSRGANGVVLITTKKGKSGKTKFGVNASTGVSKVTNTIEMLGIDQYLALRRKGFANNTTTPATPNATTAPDLLVWDQTANTDWQEYLLGNTANTYDVTSNVSGGDSRTNFYISGTYHKEGNVFPGSQNYQRGGANFNFNHASFDQKLNIGLSAIYSTDRNNISTTDLSSYAFSLAPNFPLYNPDGSLYWFSGQNNPLGYLNQTNDNRTSNLLSNLTLKYNVLKGLDIKSTFGYSKTDMTQVTKRPLTSQNPLFNPTSGTASYTYNYTNNIIIEPQITYNTNIWKGALSALVGGTYQYRQSKQPYYVNASGFSSDEFLDNISSATTISTSASSQFYKYASLFGRLNYNIGSKYILNLNFRRDGSSRFGPNNKFGNFGSVGAAWVFSEEKLLKDNLKWLSFGKLRGSYGVIGSDEIGNYQYLETYTSYSYAYNGSAGLYPTRIANSEFQWEQTKKLEVGLELGFFNDRLSLTGSYYRNRTNNQLLNFPLSPQTGFTSYQSNLPATVQNSGVELAINTTNVKAKNFNWTSSFNISANRNKLLSFPGIEKTAYYSTYIVGNPISSYYLYQYAGINPTTNLPSFTDFDGNGTLSTGLAALGRGDRYFVGTAYPKFFGGLTNSLTYKKINLDFTFQFVKQQGRSVLSSAFYPPGYFNNMPLVAAEEYLALGSQDYLVAAGTGGTNGLAFYQAYSRYTGSDASVVDASFIRLKNVSLSYTIPTKWISEDNNTSIRVYSQAQNLFTITNFKGVDPESQGMATPPLRTIVAGLQLTF